MTEENGGVEPSPADIFLRTHAHQIEDEGSSVSTRYITDKAREVHEKYQEELLRQSQLSQGDESESPAQVDEVELWSNVAPVNKAGKYFGVGNDQRRYKKKSLLKGSSSSASASSRNDSQVQMLLEENQRLKQTASDLQSSVQRHEQMFQWIMANNPDFFKSMGPFPPPSGGGGGDDGEEGGGGGCDGSA